VYKAVAPLKQLAGIVGSMMKNYSKLELMEVSRNGKILLILTRKATSAIFEQQALA
jgi:hypothetical protein